MFLFGIMVPITIFLIMQVFNDPEIFFATLMRSLGMGSTYAIVALGFVLIFPLFLEYAGTMGLLAALTEIVRQLLVPSQLHAHCINFVGKARK